ncbi:beta family protein [Hyphomicrobium zavarzinii]|uniref:beta family protein n=1 Tax=Hyphomicrobium zavarzinii TaxID=48292 RepID=UPI0003AAEB33|nr:beta family protein [Hyphomicrobium zavarzinii]
MNLTDDMYVPAVRWRQGEYQSLLRLSNAAKDRIVPLVTIPEIEFDFEEWRPRKTVHEHVHPFALRFHKKWGKRPAWVGVHPSIVMQPMDDGRDVFSYVFEGLRGYECNAVPAIPLGADAATVASVSAIVGRDGMGVGITLRLEDLMKPKPEGELLGFIAQVGAALDETDLIIDLGAPNFEPYGAFAGALIAALRKLGDLGRFRNLVLLGTAIPETFKDVGKGTSGIERHDWLFYGEFTRRLPAGMRRPVFGDYTIVHPTFTPTDMRKIKSAGKLIYTTPRSWWVKKGGAFRDDPEQMHDHCAVLASDSAFRGAAFSHGDDYIAKCAVRSAPASNQTRWKSVAINHHITHVLEDLSTLCGSP